MKTTGVISETAGDKAVPNKRGEEGKRGNVQNIIHHEAAKIHGFYIGAAHEHHRSHYPHYYS